MSSDHRPWSPFGPGIEGWRKWEAEVKRRSRGAWGAIFTILAPELDPAMALQREGRRTAHTFCVLCGEKHFRLFPDWEENGGSVCTCGTRDGILLLRHLRGWSYGETIARMDEVLRVSGPGTIIALPRQRTNGGTRGDDEENVARGRRLLAIWQESFPLDHREAAPVRLYLAKRGHWPLPCESLEDIRCHPGLAYHGHEEGDISGCFPAMVAVLRDVAGRRVTLHVTYLHDGCKAPVATPKKVLPYPRDRTLSGGAIRIGVVPGEKSGGVLGVAEGIETALAAWKLSGVPCWACYCASNLAQFAVPEGVRTVLIWADKDRSRAGEDAARTLARRLERIGVVPVVLVPPFPIPEGKKGIDWDDVLRTHGLRSILDNPIASQWRTVNHRLFGS